MKQIYHSAAREVGTMLWFGFLIILQGAGVSEAKFLSKRDSKARPRSRIGCYPTSSWSTKFRNLEDLGSHGYRHKGSEKKGIVYTCKGGHIDLAHLRKAADWTAYLAAKTLEQLRKNETQFSFKLKEPSLYFVELSYPENWTDLSQKEQEHIAHDVSIRLGQYFTFTATTWHEILTWFGYKSVGFFPELPSAFSWEDLFSDLLGTHIAVQALRDDEYEYNEAVTLAIDREFQKLGIQTKHTARQAAERVRGLWYKETLMPFGKKRKRNFDIGLDDGFVTPLIVPAVSECEGIEAQPYPVPNLEFLSEYGFSMKLEIKPRTWQESKILRIVYPNKKERKKRLKPVIHFASLMDYIKEDAVKKYGLDVSPHHSK